jgi:CHAT domain-containing protein
VVHIASHFVFRPGDGQKSYLLLAGKESAGTGYALTQADFSSNPNLDMSDTELLTLSACETGLTGSARNGIEVDGLGTTAQLKGAKAVKSSLWEVNDSSTGELMAGFYHRWASGEGKVSKAAALREAQLDLLLGKVKLRADSSAGGLGFSNPDAPAGFAHPYYWAPFILMGNWQ